MNAVIYARYSCDRQTEQSIEGQLRECKAFAVSEGIHIIGEYIDRAISGTTANRPEFQRMIADSRYKTFQAVIVYKEQITVLVNLTDKTKTPPLEQVTAALRESSCSIARGGGSATKCELTILTPSLLAISNIFKK